MAEKGGTKVLVIFTICIVLISIMLAGCTSTTAPSKNPNNPFIAINQNEDAYVTWHIYDSGDYINKYVKIDVNGHKTKEKTISKGNFYKYKLIIDSKENLNFFLYSPSYIRYIKIDNKDTKLFEKNIAISEYHEDRSTITKLFDATLDKDENIHIIGMNTNLTTSYAKISSSGDIIASRLLKNFIKNIPFEFKTITIRINMIIDQEYKIHCVWQNGYNTFDTTTGIVGAFNKTLSGNVIKIGSKGNIHILRDGSYKKLSKNGTFLMQEKIKNITKIQNYPVIEDDNGNYIYLGENGCVDKDNNVHIVSKKVETEHTGRYEYDYYTIYYTKILKNGIVYIDNMVIDTDTVQNNNENSYTQKFCFYSMIITGLMIIVAILILYLSSRINNKKVKKIKNN